MTASGRQHAAELPQIAFGSCGHDGLLMSLREASDEFTFAAVSCGRSRSKWSRSKCILGVPRSESSPTMQVMEHPVLAPGQWQFCSDCQIHMSDFHYLKLRCRMRISRFRGGCHTLEAWASECVRGRAESTLEASSSGFQVDGVRWHSDKPRMILAWASDKLRMGLGCSSDAPPMGSRTIKMRLT